MPQETGWYIEEKVIIARYWGAVTLQDIYDSAAIEHELLESARGHTVHVLVDKIGQTSSPTELIRVREALRSVLTHPAMGWTVAYGNIQDVTRDYINVVITKSFKAHYRAFPSRVQALAFLAKADHSLRGMLANNS